MSPSLTPALRQLDAWLQAHRSGDDREAQDVERVRALLRRPAPFWRQTFLPGHLTARAVVGTSHTPHAVKVREERAARAGPPHAPVGHRVSRTRQGASVW